MDDNAAVAIVAIIGLTLLGISYFIYLKQDGTVLLALSSIIGGIAGYRYGRKVAAKAK
jgi:uncharacterized membrane protein YfcA